MESQKQPDVSTATTSKKKREEKIRHKDNRSLENVLKSIDSLQESEKVETLMAKYSELYEECRAAKATLATTEKTCTKLQREKDQLQTAQSKSVLARSRLESLCRELQRQNKLVKEENVVKMREEEERRKEVAAKFQLTLNEVTSMMQENSEKNVKLRDDSLDMANKISTLCKQFEKGEAQLTRMGKQLELEKRLSEATLSKLKLEFAAEREVWSKEREALQGHLHRSEENIKVLEENLRLYTGKYEEFESSIDRSNQVFDNCKSEMVKMTKQIAALEKESTMWKLRWQNCAQSLLDITASKQNQDTQLVGTEKKLEQLQKLCRQLQVDRAAYLKLLKNNDIEPSTQICSDEQQIVPVIIQDNNNDLVNTEAKEIQEQLTEETPVDNVNTASNGEVKLELTSTSEAVEPSQETVHKANSCQTQITDNEP